MVEIPVYHDLPNVTNAVLMPFVKAIKNNLNILNKNTSYYILRCFYLININCSSNCKFQKDGKCNLDKVQNQKVSGNLDCIYFISNCQTQK